MKHLRTITSIILSIIFSTQFALSQHRYAVNPHGDIIPLAKGESAISAIRQFQKEKGKTPHVPDAVADCRPIQQFGNVPATHSAGYGTRFIFNARDILGIWFETPTSGTIDSLFIMPSADETPSINDTVRVAIHYSNIYSGHGPGYGIPGNPANPYYIAPPKVCWGYYHNSADIYYGIAPFREEASDTNWVSTYKFNNRDYPGGSGLTDHLGEIADTTLGTFPPCGEELWGDGGLDVPIHPDTVTAIDLSILPPRPVVAKGFPFFITFKNMNDPGAIEDMGNISPIDIIGYTDGSENGSLNADPIFRRNFHNWKFYAQPLFCGSGWLTRGDVDMHVWYTMTATGDIPPVFNSVDDPGSYTFKANTPRVVTTYISDCNLNPSGPAGVGHADLVYSINGGPDIHTGMINIGGSAYQGMLPGIACPGTIRYYFEATDVDSNVSHTPSLTYRVLCLGTDIALADTDATPTSGKISNDPGRHAVATTSFFVPYNDSATTHPKDDGTAGPFPIVPGYDFCGDTMNYAWIGVDGAIALSKTAADTQHVNANGKYSSFDLPVYQRRSNTFLPAGLPKNFIAGFGADFIAGDSVRDYGHIYWKNEAGRFIVEYDSLGRYGSTGAAISDQSIFRIVLNKKDRTMEFQYDNVFTNGTGYSFPPTPLLIGVQADSTDQNEFHGYVLLNKNGSPAETTPHNGQTMKLTFYYPVPMQDGWNLAFVPGKSLTGDTSVAYLYRHCASRTVFLFNGSLQHTTLIPQGVGFWLKYGGSMMEGVPVIPYDSLDIRLQSKWNIIGGISVPTPTSSLTITTPTGIYPSIPVFYGYFPGYRTVTMLYPGKAYWMKIYGEGILHIRPPQSTPKSVPEDVVDLDKLNSLTVIAGESQTLYLGDESLIKNTVNYEMPPVPPAGSFDARFSSQSMLESYPASIEKGKQYKYTIELQRGTNPVTVQWNIQNPPDGRTFVISDAIGGKVLPNTVMGGKGSVHIANASVNKLIVKLVEGIANLPKAFALGQNYPNPFNPTTTFVVAMPKTADVDVSIYNILGQKVATLLSGMQPACYHTVEWNGTNQAGLMVPSGTYFVRMVSGEFRGVQKILLMK